MAVHSDLACSRTEAEKLGGELVCYGDSVLRADDGRLLGSGAGIPEAGGARRRAFFARGRHVFAMAATNGM